MKNCFRCDFVGIWLPACPLAIVNDVVVNFSGLAGKHHIISSVILLEDFASFQDCVSIVDKHERRLMSLADGVKMDRDGKEAKLDISPISGCAFSMVFNVAVSRGNLGWPAALQCCSPSCCPARVLGVGVLGLVVCSFQIDDRVVDFPLCRTESYQKLAVSNPF